MEPPASGEFVADRGGRCDHGNDRADQFGEVGTRPVGRQEPLDAGGECVDDIGRAARVGNDRDHDGADDRRNCADGPDGSVASHQGDRGDRRDDRCDEERPLELIEDPTCRRADRDVPDQQDHDPEAYETPVGDRRVDGIR